LGELLVVINQLVGREADGKEGDRDREFAVQILETFGSILERKGNCSVIPRQPCDAKTKK